MNAHERILADLMDVRALCRRDCTDYERTVREMAGYDYSSADMRETIINLKVARQQVEDMRRSMR